MEPVYGFELRRFKRKFFIHLIKILFLKFKNPVYVFKILKDIKIKYKSVNGSSYINKVVKVDDRYFWRLGAPGFPSTAINIMHDKEINRFFTESIDTGLRVLFIAITKKCPMKCEHCFEWDSLNNKDTLSTQNIIDIVYKYQNFGATQIVFSGGEPMLKINDIYKVLDSASEQSDFWIISSGYGFTKDHAKNLKEKGLTGVMVSIDHYSAEEHDRFRNFEGAYKHAVNAVQYANQEQLVTCLSVCVTDEFISYENLHNYMEFAKEMRVSFVQIIEARSKGRFKGKKTEIKEDKIKLLEDVYLTYNTSVKYRDYPIINYIAYHQRRMGCFGGGDRFFYIDTDGYAHLCPYCEEKVADARSNTPTELISKLKEYSCHKYTIAG
jgi:MoaA/NifB/PqqE/SkfB family radical SAM enzyme